VKCPLIDDMEKVMVVSYPKDHASQNGSTKKTSKTKSLKSLSPQQASGHYRISPFGADFAGQSRSKLRL